jgi:hypothetical protein
MCNGWEMIHGQPENAGAVTPRGAARVLGENGIFESFT